MIEGMFQPMHLLLILGIVLLLFGPSKLAGLGKGLGDGIRGFKESLQEAEPSPVKQSADATLAHEDQPANRV